jgi:hypothetical protein
VVIEITDIQIDRVHWAQQQQLNMSQFPHDEFAANSPYKGNALDLFLSLKLELESKQPIEPEERNLAMRLSALYIEKIQEAQQVGEARGRQEGRTEGERELVMLLSVDFEAMARRGLILLAR